MAITQDPAPARVAEPAGEPPRVRVALTAGEVLVGGAVVLAGLVAWAGLALAHLHRYRLGGALLAAALATAALGAAALRARPRAAVRVDRGELATLALLVAVGAVLLFPGFPYGVGDKDPGTYVSHGIAIARTGSWDLADPVLDRSRVPAFQPSSPGARLPGIWYADRDGGVAHVQFYHLWPAALASAWKLGGTGALVNLNPLLGLLAVLAVALAARRAFGPVAGLLAGLLLVTCMLQVWQARYQSAEVITEAFVAAALLGVVVALRTGWRPAAGLAGLLVGLAWLARADALLLVLVAVAAGCALVALGRFDARCAWFAAGLGVVLPHALLQAYGLAAGYSAANGVPGLPAVAGLAAGGLLAAVALRALARPWLDRLAAALGRPRIQLALGLALTAVAGVAMVVGFLRPWLFGPAYFDYHGRVIRSYDEQTLRRLSWFLTLPGLALAGAGLAVVALRRWAAPAWALVLPVLLVFPVYAVRAENSSRLMWWNRRFVPVVLPGLVVLMAVALAAALAWDGGVPAWIGERWRRRARRLRLPVRVAAAGLAVALVAVFAGQSLPLRRHAELDGSFAIGERLAAAAGGRQGVYLLQSQRGEINLASWFGVPLWLQHGEVAVILRTRPDPGYVRAFVRGFPGQPVFLVTAGGEPPPGYQALGLRRVDHIRAGLPVWDESNERRPDGAHLVAVDLSVWRVTVA
ncbi:MAG TPA: hypothetical protein VKG45_02615 [Actinomycetes bacterium]|nr:hypothetical protein [Actinomycetes bacterium]